MNKKNITLLILLLYAHFIHAQVGINTESPQSTLDVNGNIQVRKDIKLGENEGTAGSPGAAGSSFFTSQGPGKPPLWLTSEGGEQTFAITQSLATSDETGAKLTQEFGYSNMIEYPENMLLNTSDGWVEIPGLASTINPSRVTNKVVFNLQTIVQSPSFGPFIDADVAIGIFVDKQLKAVRSVHLSGDQLSFVVFNLIDAINNLPPKTGGTVYNVQVAANLRYFNYNPDINNSTPSASDKIIQVGYSSADTYNTNAMMNRTSFKIDVFEDMTQSPVIE